MTRDQKLVMAFETLEFARLADALACKALYLGLDKSSFVMTLVNSWNDANVKATTAVDYVEAADKEAAEPAKAVPGKDKN